MHDNDHGRLRRDNGLCENEGLFGRACEPQVVRNPAAAPGAIPGLATQAELPTVRLDERLSLKASLDQAAQRLEENQRALDLNRLYGQAYDKLASPSAREAFNLEAEPSQVR